jgi:hypothetical protein
LAGLAVVRDLLDVDVRLVRAWQVVELVRFAGLQRGTPALRVGAAGGGKGDRVAQRGDGAATKIVFILIVCNRNFI